MTLVIKFQPGLRPIIKHLAGQHDQKTHGSWSQGITDEFNTWSPKDKVPPSPPNKGSVPAKAWDNWEHGPDGTQYTDLYRYYAGQMLGLKVPESPFLPGGWANYLTQRGFGGSSLETSKKHAEAMLKAIEKGHEIAHVKAIVSTGKIEDRILAMVITGIGKKPLNNLEEGEAYKRLKEHGLDVKEIALKVGKSLNQHIIH